MLLTGLLLSPRSERSHGRLQCSARRCKGVRHSDRWTRLDAALDNAAFFKFPQPFGEHSLRDAVDRVRQFTEARLTLEKECDDLPVPAFTDQAKDLGNPRAEGEVGWGAIDVIHYGILFVSDAFIVRDNPNRSNFIMSDSTTLVPAGTWNADASHSSVNFSVRHLGIAKLRGKFGEFSGSLTSDGTTTTGAGTIAVASISTGDEGRDHHLHGEEFFNAAVHTAIEYTIASVEAHGDKFHVNGEITINGITKPLSLEAAHGGTGVDPWGNERVGVDLRGHISRKDFGMTFDADNALVSDKVAIELDFSLVKAA